jgi:hypothetical protein
MESVMDVKFLCMAEAGVLSGLSSLYEGFDSKKICEIEARGS